LHNDHASGGDQCAANTRDYDFSRATVQARWHAGYADTRRMLERRPWDDPVDPATEITVYQSDAAS
jgi:NTE family protein